MQLCKTEGIVLHSFKFRDYDQIITLFTPNEGSIKLIFKGSFSRKYSNGALATPLTKGEFIYAKGKKELHLCKEISLVDQRLHLRKHFSCLEACFEILSALNSSQMPMKAAPRLYALLDSYLTHIGDFQDPHVLSASFRLKILKHDGHLGLFICSICQKELKDSYSAGGESYCFEHQPLNALEFCYEETLLIKTLAFSTTFTQLHGLKLPPILNSKIKLLFEDSLSFF